MRDPTVLRRRELSTYKARASLKIQHRPYYALLRYGRHIGVHCRPDGMFWVARIRTKAGSYHQMRLGKVAGEGEAHNSTCFDYETAVQAAEMWFSKQSTFKLAADARPLGITRHLVICPVGDTFTIGHALGDYVEWKRLAAAKTHFETSLALINYHLVPRLASLPVAEFTGDVFRRLVRDVIETPPKRGNRRPGPRIKMESLEAEPLRKRKKTVNAIVGILRLAFQLAWESGKLENDRPLRCLKRLPSVDRPRILHLSREECRTLLGACRSDVHDLVLGALYTGCRVAELVRMRCSHVGRDGYGVYVTPVKRYRERFVFLPDEAMIWFLGLIKGRKPNDFVFRRYDGTPWLDRSYRYSFRTAVEEAELPEGFTFHGLRHTYASQLIQAGATVFAVAEQLGHADPQSVLKTYGHLSPQIRESEVRQRFTPLSPDNVSWALESAEELKNWRGSLYGANWETYAVISNLRATKMLPLVTLSRVSSL